MAFQVKNCCCLFSLRTGTIVIGSLSLVSSVVYLWVYSVALSDPHAEVHEILKEAEDDDHARKDVSHFLKELKEDYARNPSHFYPVLEAPTPSPEEVQFKQQAAKWITGVYSVIVVLLVLEIAMDLVVIVGACVRLARPVRVFVVYRLITLVVGVVLLVVSLVLFRQVGDDKESRQAMGTLLIGVPIQIYYLCVVHSYYKELTTNEDPRLTKV